MEGHRHDALQVGKDQILSVTEQSVKILRQVFKDILKDTDSIKRARTSLE